jgi:deoxyribodipyrimidine photo-lyase
VRNKEVILVWFKKDLRLSDNPALTRAIAERKPVLPIYIFEPEYWSLPDTSFRHWSFIHDSLEELRSDLAARGQPLVVMEGDVLEVFNWIATSFKISKIYSNEETGNNWTYKRDLKVKEYCKENSIEWNEFPSNGVVRKLQNRDEWTKIRNKRMAEKILPDPSKFEGVPFFNPGEIPSKDRVGEISGNVQTGGRVEAIKILQSFVDYRAKNYMKTLSKPGVSARNCTRLSAHIANGTISVREAVQAVERKISDLESSFLNIKDLASSTQKSFILDEDLQQAKSQYRGLTAALSRLAWRDHFVQKLEQQPDIEFKCMHPAYEELKRDANQYRINAWYNGRTGIPIIDACMRSLHENGWLTFRMRAMVMSFASYNLGLDWRATSPLLAQLFTDYEPGIHYSQVQMQSGTTGINTIRIYNPIKQSMDHDKSGKFIKRYLPELEHIPAEWIHEPSKIPELIKKDLNIKLTDFYENPIIDIEKSAKVARAEISRIHKLENYKDNSIKVFNKLGSRKTSGQKTPAKRSKKISPDQLNFGF